MYIIAFRVLKLFKTENTSNHSAITINTCLQCSFYSRQLVKIQVDIEPNIGGCVGQRWKTALARIRLRPVLYDAADEIANKHQTLVIERVLGIKQCLENALFCGGYGHGLIYGVFMVLMRVCTRAVYAVRTQLDGLTYACLVCVRKDSQTTSVSFSPDTRRASVRALQQLMYARIRRGP